MSWLARLWSDIFGLFVDDGRFAGAILAWVAIAWLLFPQLRLPPALPPIALFTGLAVILVRAARARARRG